MESDEERFRVAYEKLYYGNKAMREPQEQDFRHLIYRHVSYAVRGIMEGARQVFVGTPTHSKMPEVIGGVMLENEINGRAFIHPVIPPSNRVYYVGVTFGTYLHLLFVYKRLLCFGEVLPWIGDTSAEYVDPMFFETPLKHQVVPGPLESTLLSNGKEYPRDLDRKDAASLLFAATNTALVSHEVRHALGGHLDYLAWKTGQANLMEADAAVSSSQESLEFQAIELDADSAACEGLIIQLVALSQANDHPASCARLFPDKKHVLAAAMLCMDTLFKLFELRSHQPPSKWLDRRHPPSLVRRIHASLEILKYARWSNFLNTEPDDSYLEMVGDIHRISDEITGKLFGESPVDEAELNLRRSLAVDHYQLIMNRWDEIRSEVSSHRFCPLRSDMVQEQG